uniref:Zinc finger homeobox 3b n=1 Tax=Seriola dumerili TaxID=41447 RepID=A0A3B4V0J4_SERDU
MDVRLGGGQLVSEELMTLGESLSQTSDPSLKLFQCAVCNRFTTDNLDVLGMHMGAERSLPEEEWRAVVGDSHQCKLCHYTTQLKANFQLHCKTDKHVQKYQLVAHIKEGGKGNEWRLKCVAIGNPVHLKCNACDYYTNSLEKLRMHTVNSRHEASLKLYKHLQQHENAVEGDACYYHCVLCNYSTKAKLNLIQHVRSMKHQRSESLRKLQRLQKGLPEEEEDLSSIFTIRKCPSSDTGELSEDVEAASETTTDQEDQTKDRESGGEKELTKGTGKMYQCPYCKFTNTDLNRLRMHVMTQHSVQPMLRCPLCQDMLNNKIHLQFHLTHLHSVAPDCVDKLIATVTTEVLPASMFIPVPSPDRESQSTPHATYLTLLEIWGDDTTGFLCWKKGCNQVFKSSNSLQMHFNEVHNKRPQLPVSDRHVYKYRCNQCSLAFKTVEKLQLHSQYHVIRAATMCCLCQRSFRTLQALKKHLETSHLELSEADIQQLYGGLLMNGDIMIMGDPSLGEEHGSLGEDDKEGDESDPEEKQSPTGSDSGSLQEDSGSEPKRALPFRKGPNFTMEKFLDPSRPFKCTVCKESFTQKNILLVHYNSVSHLHKVKRALQESTTGQPEPTSSPDNKPFKCSTCNVAYSQSSTLEIHMRSVLHQTKARAAKLEAAGGITSSASTPGLSGGGSGISTSTSSPSPATNSTTSSTNHNTAVPATSMPTPGMEYVVDPAQLQALQAALASDPTALLTNQFLPYFMPGFSPYYTPQIPGALQGGYLQPMYGMESLFPYNPALSQALMGLSPGSLLQHYQQYQQSLQEALQQQQRQLQQIQQPKASQTPVPSQSLGDRKESAKDPVKTEEQKGNSHSEPPTSSSSSSSSSSHNKVPSEQNEMDGKAGNPHLDQYIVPKVQYKLACRKCQAVFTKEEAAITHLKSNCFFGQSVANLQEMLLRVPGGVGAGAGSLYDCLACDTTLDGEKALSQHLESALHKHRTIKRSARNAKEHATSLLPHSSACFPNPNTASTSQSATHPISSPPPPPTTSATMPSSAVSSSLCSSSTTPLNTTAAGKPWPQAPFSRALAGKPNASPSSSSSSFPPVSSPSTVTSSSLSTSGVQTSIPTDVFTDESDSDSSQKSADRLGRMAEEPQQPGFVKDSSSCSSKLASVGTDSIRL